MSLLKSLWYDPSIVERISTGLNWSIAALGLAVLTFGGRSSYLQGIEADRQTQRIADLEEKTKPVPLRKRLSDFIDSMNPEVLRHLAKGQTTFTSVLPPFQYSDLQKLAAEDVGAHYIVLDRSSALVFVPNGGNGHTVSFELKPALLNEDD